MGRSVKKSIRKQRHSDKILGYIEGWIDVLSSLNPSNEYQKGLVDMASVLFSRINMESKTTPTQELKP